MNDTAIKELRTWLLVDPMTLTQAASLAVGAIPVLGRPKPAAFTPLLQAAIQAAEKGELAVTFDAGRGKSPRGPQLPDSLMVSQADVRKWLHRKHVTSAIFFLVPPDYWPSDEIWSSWARQDLWSHAEFSEICCGRVPGTPNRADSDQLEINAASELIARGSLSGSLHFVGRSDGDSKDVVYGKHRFYEPSRASKWAAKHFDAFPSVLVEGVDEKISQAGSLEKDSHEKELGLRAEASYLNIIGTMLALLLGKSPSGKAHSVFKSQAAVVDALVSSYGSVDGISKRNLDDKFGKANWSVRTI